MPDYYGIEKKIGKSMPYENWEDERELGRAVPTSLSELGSRISQVLALYHDRKSASEVAGKSVDQLLAYVKGASAPPWVVLVKLALGVGVSLDWLATGSGAMLQSDQKATSTPKGNDTALDTTALRNAIEIVDDWLYEHNRRMTSAKKAEVVALAYEILVESDNAAQPEQGRNNIVRLLRVAS